MLRLIQTEEFKTIISSCSIEEQVQKAFDNFILKIVALCDTEEDTVSLFRILRYTRRRLQAMQKAYPLNGEGEKCVRTTQCHWHRVEVAEDANAGLFPALSVKPTKKLHWTGKVTDLVELLFMPLTPVIVSTTERLA